MERLKWIDFLRGFCMMAILWFHSEMYYVGYDFTPYAFYVGDVLAVFFIISGYLLHKSTLINYKKKVYSILRFILLPYFIFTSFIAVFKLLIYKDRNVTSLIYDIVTGNASWFIAALIVSQLLFIFFLRITKEKILYLSILSICFLLLSYFVGNSYNPSPLFYKQNLWHFNESLLGVFLLFIGYLYHRYESKIILKNTTILIIFLFIIVIITKYFIYKHDMQLIVGPIIVSNYPIFIIDLLCSSFLLIYLAKKIPSNKMIEWTGSHSIAYYFICGGVPLIISKLFHKIGIVNHNYFTIFCVFILVYIVSSFITWLIYKYTPIFKKIDARV